MSAGPWTLFDRWVWVNSVDGAGNLLTENIYCVITGAAQALTAAFVGASGDCRYADLTAELGTASGYTAGGIILPNKAITNDGDYAIISSDPWEWNISAPLTGKYAVLMANSRPNKDLIAFCDLDLSGGSTVTINGVHRYTPDIGGILKWRQP